MDNGGQHGNERHRMELYGGVHPPWNMMPQHQMKEANAMNKKLVQIIADKNAAIEELNRAITNRNSAIQERNEAIKLRDEAISARDTAYRERDSAMAALRFHEGSVNSTRGAIRRGGKRKNHSSQYHGAQITDVLPLSMVQSDDYMKPCQARSNSNESKPKAKSPLVKLPKKVKIEGGDVNRHVTTSGSKAEWEAQDPGLIEMITFDEKTMSVPVCTCTGVPRPCYKWGHGGWQSSCCTTSLSVFPLPQMPNKRHGRIGGRKMSGSVFSRLLSRMAADGHDLSIPLDLKNYWAKHGTNRYITIK